MRYFLFLMCLLAESVAIAQDQIFKKDNTKVEAKILEINQAEIRYKLFTYQDGPMMIINKSEVAMIIYQNGTHEVFNTPVPAPDTAAPVAYQRYDKPGRSFDALTSTRQVVFLNIMDLSTGSVGGSYLREFAHNKINVYVPISVAFTEDFVLNNQHSGADQNPRGIHYRKIVDAGLGINYQVARSRSVFFIGILAGMNQFRGSYDYITDYDYTFNGQTYSDTKLVHYTYVANNYYLLVNAGILFRLSRHFNMMLNTAAGPQQTVYINGDPAKAGYGPYYYTKVSPFGPLTARIGLSLGYRF